MSDTVNMGTPHFETEGAWEDWREAEHLDDPADDPRAEPDLEPRYEDEPVVHTRPMGLVAINAVGGVNLTGSLRRAAR